MVRYVKQVTSYYDILKKFVSRVAPYIDQQEWLAFADLLNTNMPGIKDIPVSILNYLKNTQSLYKLYYIT